MENQVTTIVCPNCGANTTNRHNCEYCGSLLVRFVDNGISFDGYQKDAFVYDGLESALKSNILLQDTSGDNKICITDVDSPTDSYAIQFIPSYEATFGLETQYNPFENAPRPSLAVRLPFEINCPDESVAIEERRALAAFKKMDIFQLFTEVGAQYAMTYYIDFGADYEGAAKMFTNIMKKVYNCTEETPLSFNTSLLDKKDVTIQISDSSTTSKKKIIWIGVIVLAIYILSEILF